MERYQPLMNWILFQRRHCEVHFKILNAHGDFSFFLNYMFHSFGILQHKAVNSMFFHKWSVSSTRLYDASSGVKLCHVYFVSLVPKQRPYTWQVQGKMLAVVNNEIQR